MNSIIEHIKKRNEERSLLIDAFTKAGYEHLALTETPNRYMNDRVSLPWFFVTTEHGFFMVGWRKRVYHLDWGDSLTIPYNLFKPEADAKITTGPTYIHCWGTDKLIEYLKRLKEQAEVTEREEIKANGYPVYPAALHWLREIEETAVLDRVRDLLYKARADRKRLMIGR